MVILTYLPCPTVFDNYVPCFETFFIYQSSQKLDFYQCSHISLQVELQSSYLKVLIWYFSFSGKLQILYMEGKLSLIGFAIFGTLGGNHCHDYLRAVNRPHRLDSRELWRLIPHPCHVIISPCSIIWLYYMWYVVLDTWNYESVQKEGEQARGLASVAVKLGPVKLALFYSTPYGSLTNYVDNKVGRWYILEMSTI